MSTYDNKAVFRSSEFDSWASRELLIPAEQFLIQNYLDKRAKTLEGGTGGGRILLDLKARGFTSLYGFDFLPEFVERAKQKDPTNEISFEIQDAKALRYDAFSFDQIIYLQQVICFIEDELVRRNAVGEAYRILRTGGIGIFSFLSYEARNANPFYRPYLRYLSTLRKLSGSTRTMQYLPWLKLGGSVNFASLLDEGPYVYWYRLTELHRLLSDVGFQVVAIGSTEQIKENKIHQTLDTLARERIKGMIYVVVTK